jgi:2-iminobutanoate/2-iminopropanoate deaminase
MTTPSAAGGERIEHRIPGLADPIGHFSNAVSCNGTLYISGLVGSDERGAIVGPDDITQQARQVYKNIKTALAHVGLDYSDLLKITTYLVSVADRGKVDEVRRAAFGETKPASTLIGIRELAHPDILIEVEAIATFRK